MCRGSEDKGGGGWVEVSESFTAVIGVLVSEVFDPQ